MGIGEWFTAFSLFVAVYALFSSEERRIIGFKLSKYDPYLVIGILTATLVFIKYPEIYNRFDSLKKFDVAWGLDAKNWALLLFLGGAIFYAIKLLRIPKKLPSEELIGYYQNLMKQDFKLFYKLFNKYEREASDNQHFENYKFIIFEPAFLEGVNNQPYYYSNLLDKIDQSTFKKYFTGLLNNHDSIFYKELAANFNSYLVENENYFLYKLLHHTPGLFFRIGGLIILRDWHVKYLENEKLKRGQSMYNQSPDLVVRDFALSLPLYLHIQFISLLYQEAIVQKSIPVC